MFWFEVENIDWKHRSSKKVISLCLKMALKLTVIVIENDIGKVKGIRVDGLEEILWNKNVIREHSS